jgi:hypothetical protein
MKSQAEIALQTTYPTHSSFSMHTTKVKKGHYYSLLSHGLSKVGLTIFCIHQVSPSPLPSPLPLPLPHPLSSLLNPLPSSPSCIYHFSYPMGRGERGGESFLFPLSSFLFPLSSFLFPLSSFLFPLSSFLFPLSSFLFPPSSFLLSPSPSRYTSHQSFSFADKLEVATLLQLHPREVYGPNLPSEKFGSDHILLMADLAHLE